MKLVGSIHKAFSFVNKWIMRIFQLSTLTCLATSVVVIFYSVVSRNFLNASIAWAEELSRILFIWVVFNGAVLGLYHREHLGLDILVAKLKPKSKTVFDIIGWILIIVVTRAMIIGGHEIVSAISKNRTAALRLPSTLNYWPVVLAGYAMTLIAVENMLGDIIKLFKSGAKDI